MPSVSRGSTAYRLQPVASPQRKTAPQRQQKAKGAKKHSKVLKHNLIMAVAVVFLVQLFLCSRWVTLYGMHNDIEQKTKQLEQLQMENEQTTLAIDSMIDSSKVEEYAKNELGMRKAESSQIVYVEPVHGDSMQKVAKKNNALSKRGLFGILSSTLGNALEYLK